VAKLLGAEVRAEHSLAFELDSFFLKTPARIGALMIMTLCLMVYNFAQYHLRQCLHEYDEVLPNQLGRPIKNPTVKRIAELMDTISVVTISTAHSEHRLVTNVKKVHQRIIAYFGPYALDIYGLPPDLTNVEIDYQNYKIFYIGAKYRLKLRYRTL
jgi:hypothetical protein